jgi:hypothetical protein
MVERWQQVAPDADEKQEKRFEIWLSGSNIPFQSSEAQGRYRERVTLIKDAVQMGKKPNRVPVCPSPGHFPLEYAGITFYDAMYDVNKLMAALRKYYDDFDPDTYSGSFIGSGKILDLLDAKQYRWPGHGVSRDKEYQFIEGEYMKADEYDDLINDPSGFHMSVFLPRICGALKSFEKFPPLVNLRHMSTMFAGTFPFSLPEIQETFKILMEAGAEAARWMGASRELSEAIMGRGYPSLAGGQAETPYDIIADSFRGTRGVSLDMKRCPDKLKQACEKYVLPSVKRGAAGADLSGNPLIFMPLHKGAHSFMSKAQYREFYWPTLRKVLIGLINEGLVPLVFAESNYESRLEIITDLPKGKTIWWFEQVDMARAKETIGQVACIAGNVPNILFRAGTPDDIKGYCKKLIDVAGKDGGFILSTAAGLQGAKQENVKTLIDYSKAYGVYS